MILGYIPWTKKNNHYDFTRKSKIASTAEEHLQWYIYIYIRFYHNNVIIIYMGGFRKREIRQINSLYWTMKMDDLGTWLRKPLFPMRYHGISPRSMGNPGSWNGGTVPFFRPSLVGYIPLHSPYIGLIYGRYLEFGFLEWPLTWYSCHLQPQPLSLLRLTETRAVTLKALQPLAQVAEPGRSVAMQEPIFWSYPPYFLRSM